MAQLQPSLSTSCFLASRSIKERHVKMCREGLMLHYLVARAQDLPCLCVHIKSLKHLMAPSSPSTLVPSVPMPMQCLCFVCVHGPTLTAAQKESEPRTPFFKVDEIDDSDQDL
eukprot:scaffold207637_cov26-Tisochrysis_lutea.AAC.1